MFQHPFIRSLVNVFLPNLHILHHLLGQCMLRWWSRIPRLRQLLISRINLGKVFYYRLETVIEESQKEEETGLTLCTFPAPCSCVCSRGPRTPILTGADAGQPKSVGHVLSDLEAKFVVPQVTKILPAPRNEIP